MFENPWTDDRVEWLTRLWATGVSASIIGEQMKITRNMVLGKVHRLGLPAREPRVATGEAKKRSYPKTRAPATRSLFPRIKPEPYLVQVADVEPLHIGIMQLDKTTCRYPLGDGPFTFCGHSVKADSSYCAAHHSICFYKPQKVRAEVRPAPYPWKAPRRFSGAWA